MLGDSEDGNYYKFDGTFDELAIYAPGRRDPRPLRGCEITVVERPV